MACGCRVLAIVEDIATVNLGSFLHCHVLKALMGLIKGEKP